MRWRALSAWHYPTEYHAQTAVEAAFRLHAQVVHRIDEVRRCRLTLLNPR